MSAAEALPAGDPWRDTSHLDRIPTATELAAAPPPNEAGRALHDANVAKLVTQAAWAVKPFTPDELRADRLDELEGIWSGLFESNGPWYEHPADLAILNAQYKRVERLIGWPTSEPSDWS